VRDDLHEDESTTWHHGEYTSWYRMRMAATKTKRKRNDCMLPHLVSSLKSANLDTTLLSDADGIKYSISEAKCKCSKPTRIDECIDLQDQTRNANEMAIPTYLLIDEAVF
jgi:hypothetical protein